MKKKICIILTKNTAELEYLLPILDNKSYSFDICVFDYNKDRVIKKNSELNNYLIKKKIKIFDIKYFIKNKFLILNFLGKIIESNSLPIRSILSKLKKKFSIFFLYLLIKNFLNRILKETFHVLFFCLKKNSLSIEYEYVLLGHRDFISFFFYKIFKNLVINKPHKYVFIPHGPHYAEIFTHKITQTEKLLVNKNYVNIVANNIEKPWLNKLYSKNRCLKFGYPLFFNHIKKTKKRNKILNLLIISRRFDFKKLDYKSNEFTIHFDNFRSFLKPVINIKNKVKIYFKPHPTTNINVLNKILNDLKIKNFEIIEDPIYFNLKKFDLVYSYHSTALFLPVLNSLPVIYFKDKSIYKLIRWSKKVLSLYNNVYLKVDEKFDFNQFLNQKFLKIDKQKINKKRRKLERVFIKSNPNRFFKEINKIFKKL